ncbi:MAG: DUF4278 domain-containing protein [Cyanobacteria bacterium P01_A01_bin.105]
MQLKYRGIAYTPKVPTSAYPFSVTGRYRGCPIQLGEPQLQPVLRAPRQLVYRGVAYEAS